MISFRNGKPEASSGRSAKPGKFNLPSAYDDERGEYNLPDAYDGASMEKGSDRLLSRLYPQRLFHFYFI